jgi:hypothetical protein
MQCWNLVNSDCFGVEGILLLFSESYSKITSWKRAYSLRLRYSGGLKTRGSHSLGCLGTLCHHVCVGEGPKSRLWRGRGSDVVLQKSSSYRKFWGQRAWWLEVCFSWRGISPITWRSQQKQTPDPVPEIIFDIQSQSSSCICRLLGGLRDLSTDPPNHMLYTASSLTQGDELLDRD